MNKLYLYWNSTSIMYLLLIVGIMLMMAITPVMAQVDSKPNEPPTIEGSPIDPIECVSINGKCEPNKRMIVYAVYDAESVPGKGEQLKNLLEGQQTLKKPRVVETPVTKFDDGKYETVSTSFEFANDEIAKIDNIKFRIGSVDLFQDAAFIRITTFDTWHHFGEDQLRPCELIDVVEFGDSDILLNT